MHVQYVKMFIVRCCTFQSIVPCLFDFILMPLSSLQECYMMLTCWDCCNLMICLFHCILCVHPMSMSSICILFYIMSSLQGCMPCIFVIYVVTSTSMPSSLRDVADCCDLVISAKSVAVAVWCHVNLLPSWVLCLIWRCSLRVFCFTCYAISIHALVCIYSLL